MDAEKKPKTDPTLADPQCVFQIVKRFYSRYTPEMVEEITGVPPKAVPGHGGAFLRHRAAGKAGPSCMPSGAPSIPPGWRLSGVIRFAAATGERRVAGGGINALRGENDVQGSTDMAILFNTLTGYWRPPRRPPHLEGLYCQDPERRLLG